MLPLDLGTTRSMRAQYEMQRSWHMGHVVIEIVHLLLCTTFSLTTGFWRRQGDVTEPMVPNPRHIKPKQLRTEVENRGYELRLAYRPLVSTIHSGKIWTGPTSVTWTHDLEDRHQTLGRLAQHLVRVIDEELRRHPEEENHTWLSALRPHSSYWPSP